jgi:hypothetical protein
MKHKHTVPMTRASLKLCKQMPYTYHDNCFIATQDAGMVPASMLPPSQYLLIVPPISSFSNLVCKVATADTTTWACSGNLNVAWHKTAYWDMTVLSTVAVHIMWKGTNMRCTRFETVALNPRCRQQHLASFDAV